MIPRTLIDKAFVPGGGELRLIQRGDEYSITLGGNELMNSRLGGSEEALATLACVRIGPNPTILIGGLGMGFTLRAALGATGSGAKLVVAELVPEIVRWARGPMAQLHGDSLTDRRVTIVEDNVAELIAEQRSTYDAILLDVDNGPDGLTRDDNDRLYSEQGLGAAQAALRPGGVLAIWSAAPDEAFKRRLGRARLDVEEVVVRARGGRSGARHIVWLGMKRR